MKKLKEVTAVIPVRKGSQRVRGKNLRHFSIKDGDPKSLLEWKIEQLLEFLPANNILVSSDWEQALDVAGSYGVTLDERPEHLAQADSPFEDLIQHCGKLAQTEYMAWAPATSPFIGSSSMFELCSEYIGLNENTVEKGMIATSKEFSYFLMGGRPLNFPIGKGHVQTQEIQPLMRWDWAFCIREREAIVREKYMFSQEPLLYEIDGLSNVDINEELDFLVAQELCDLYLKREQNAE